MNFMFQVKLGFYWDLAKIVWLLGIHVVYIYLAYFFLLSTAIRTVSFVPEMSDICGLPSRWTWSCYSSPGPDSPSCSKFVALGCWYMYLIVLSTSKFLVLNHLPVSFSKHFSCTLQSQTFYTDWRFENLTISTHLAGWGPEEVKRLSINC